MAGVEIHKQMHPAGEVFIKRVILMPAKFEKIQGVVIGVDEIVFVRVIIEVVQKLQIDALGHLIQHIFQPRAERTIIVDGHAHVIERQNLETGDKVAVFLDHKIVEQIEIRQRFGERRPFVMEVVFSQFDIGHIL